MIDSSAGPARQRARPGRRGAARRARAWCATARPPRALERRRPGPRRPLPARALDRRRRLAAAGRPALRELARSGIRLTSIGPRTTRPPVPLVPGASHDGAARRRRHRPRRRSARSPTSTARRSSGFGHPFLGAGPSRFLMGDGYVYQTIAAPITGSQLQARRAGHAAGHDRRRPRRRHHRPVGPVEGDRRASARRRDPRRGTASTVRATIAPDDRTAPIIAAACCRTSPPSASRDGLGARHPDAAGRRSRAPTWRSPFIYRNVYAAAGDVVTLASGQAAPARWRSCCRTASARCPISAIRVDRAHRAGGARRADRRRPHRPAPGAPRAAGPPCSCAPALAGAGAHDPGAGAHPRPRSSRAAPRCGWCPTRSGGFDPLPADLTQDLGAGSGPARAPRRGRSRADRFAARASGHAPERCSRALAPRDRRPQRRRPPARPGEDARPHGRHHGRVPYVIYGGPRRRPGDRPLALRRRSRPAPPGCPTGSRTKARSRPLDPRLPASRTCDPAATRAGPAPRARSSTCRQKWWTRAGSRRDRRAG